MVSTWRPTHTLHAVSNSAQVTSDHTKIFQSGIRNQTCTRYSVSTGGKIMNKPDRILKIFLIAAAVCICGVPFAIMSQNRNGDSQGREFGEAIQKNARDFMAQGQQTFRFDTFGDEAFWGDSLKLHQAIAGAKLGGVGPGVSPLTALAVGLKVDSDALPSRVTQAIREGHVDLNDPANTLALLRSNAVVG